MCTRFVREKADRLLHLGRCDVADKLPQQPLRRAAFPTHAFTGACRGRSVALLPLNQKLYYCTPGTKGFYTR